MYVYPQLWPVCLFFANLGSCLTTPPSRRQVLAFLTTFFQTMWWSLDGGGGRRAEVLHTDMGCLHRSEKETSETGHNVAKSFLFGTWRRWGFFSRVGCVSTAPASVHLQQAHTDLCPTFSGEVTLSVDYFIDVAAINDQGPIALQVPSRWQVMQNSGEVFFSK